MKKQIIPFVIMFLIFSSISVYAEEQNVFQDVSVQPVSTSNQQEIPESQIEQPVEKIPVVQQQNETTSPYFYEAYVKSAYHSTSLVANNYNKFITRGDNLRFGMHVPLFNNSLELDPYVGGQLYYGGNQESWNNFIAPAFGFRTKFLKNIINDNESIFPGFFKETEFFLEKRSLSILADAGGAYYGKKDDLVWGIKNYKEYWQDKTWEQFYFSFLHYDNYWQNLSAGPTGLAFESDFVFYANVKLGYNLTDSNYQDKDAWNIGPYYHFEMFKTMSSANKWADWFNLHSHALGFHARYTFKREGWHTTWLDFFIEYQQAYYFDITPVAGVPDSDLLIGIEFWQQ